jgi:hypothetical protein
MAVHWENSQHTSFTLWDIDREFQNAHEAYEQWQARNRRRRPVWACLSVKSQDDELGRALSLGRQVQRLLEVGKELFGTRFEQGDCTSWSWVFMRINRTNPNQRNVTPYSLLSSFVSSTKSDSRSTTVRYLIMQQQFLMTT